MRSTLVAQLGTFEELPESLCGRNQGHEEFGEREGKVTNCATMP